MCDIDNGGLDFGDQDDGLVIVKKKVSTEAFYEKIIRYDIGDTADFFIKKGRIPIDGIECFAPGDLTEWNKESKKLFSNPSDIGENFLGDSIYCTDNKKHYMGNSGKDSLKYDAFCYGQADGTPLDEGVLVIVDESIKEPVVDDDSLYRELVDVMLVAKEDYRCAIFIREATGIADHEYTNRFKGLYKLDRLNSILEKRIIWEKVEDTYVIIIPDEKR